MTMLDRMRRHKNWLKWSLAIVVLTFILLYIPDFVQTRQTATTGAGPREVVAQVNGRTVTAGDFQQRYLSQVQAYRQQFGGSLNDQLLRQLGVDQQILSQMIDEQVGLIEAEQNGITVSDDELAQQIFSIPGLQENGRFIGEQRYEQLLRSQNPPMTKAQFEETLRRSMVLDKLRAALTDWMAISDSDVDREYKQRNEKVKLQVVALTAAKFRDKVTVSDADIAAHFEAHKAEYRIGEQRKIKYILFKTEGKDDAAVKKQAEEVLAQVKAGGDFAALAKKYSEDEGSKVNGGDLDYFGRGRMVPEFEKAAFEMAPGQISDLVKSQFGYHIIKVVDKRAASARSLDEVRAQITEQLSLQQADQKITDQAAQIASRIKDMKDLEPVARELQLMVQESGFFQQSDPIPGIGSAPQVTAAAFKLQGTAASEPLGTPRGPIFIAVSERKDPYVPMLDEVKSRVREDLTRSKAADLSRERATAVAASLKSAKDFSAAAKAQGVEAKDTELVARGAALPEIGVSPEVERVAFTLPKDAVSDPIQTADGTVIVRVVDRENVTPEKLQQSREAFRAELLGERRARFFSAYMGKAKEKMKVEVKTDVLRRVLAAYRT